MVGPTAFLEMIITARLFHLIAAAWTSKVVGAAATDPGHVEFAQTRVSATEQSRYVAVTVLRHGGSAGALAAIVGSLANETTAEEGVDFEVPLFPMVWLDGDVSPRAISVKILDDSGFEREEHITLIFLAVEPHAGHGTINQKVVIKLGGDTDGGRFTFNPSGTVDVLESPSTERWCALWASRTGGNSGTASLRLEIASCTVSAPGPEATPELDFRFRPATEMAVWEDGDNDTRCVLWNVPSRHEGLRSNESGLSVIRDGASEKNEVICFAPVLGQNSTATVASTQLVVRLQDLGVDGGDVLRCYRGSDCVLSWDLSSSAAQGGDTLYFHPDCASCGAAQLGEQLLIDQSRGAYSVSLGRSFDDRDPVKWQLCVCVNGSDTPVLKGSFTLQGPEKGNSVVCARGRRRCFIAPLQGKYDSPAGSETRQEFVQILADCKTPFATHRALLEGGGAAIQTSGAFVIDDGEALSEAPTGIYQLCWCRVTAEHNCTLMEHFTIEAGLAVLAGPQLLEDQVGVIGSPFVVRGVAGISLSEEDVARLQPECGSDSPSHVDARFDVGLRGYNFGQLRNEVILAGSYEVCWCQPAEYDDVFCNTSSDFKAHFGSVHVMCQVGFVSKGGVCDECHLFILVPNEARTRCELDVGALAQVITSMVLAAIALSIFLAQLEVSATGRLRLSLHGRRMFIDDVSPEGARTIVVTRRPHGLTPRRGVRIPVRPSGTGHFRLDGAPAAQKFWTVRSVGPSRLELLDALGEPPTDRMDASMGVLAVGAWSRLRSSVVLGVLPVLPTSASLLVVSAAVLAAMPTAPRPFYIAVIVGTELVCALAFAACWRLAQAFAMAPRIVERLTQYELHLASVNPDPKPCARGPGRAVSALELFTLYDFFQVFIRDRTMYYLNPTVVQPLCAAHRLSYAERVGPHQVQWFVSHFWGTQFRLFCESVRRHALATCGESGEAWKTSTYWICTFSNNQYKVEEEVGQSHTDSSFYLALRGGTCKGTCLILDESALPLTRSWCLFELLQTIQLERQQAGFGGLLFCTANGVLNFGAATVEVAMNIGKKLAGLSLQNADATCQVDKDMINAVVIEEMGSFDAIDYCLREHIDAALHKCKDSLDGEFTTLFSDLQHAIEDDPGPTLGGPRYA